MPPLLVPTAAGLYCPAGGFHIDPHRRVRRAVVTHAHSDHARPGSERYLAAEPGRRTLQARLGPNAAIMGVPYGQALDLDGVRVSLHPAGHVLGSAQVRVEHRGETWVVTGDHKRDDDPTCAPFEPVRCHTLVTETTFALPCYRWDPPAETFAAIDAWWRGNRTAGRTSVLFCYSLGKAQRLLAGVDASIGPILTHPAAEAMTQTYRDSGVALPTTLVMVEQARPPAGALALAPPQTLGTPWLERLAPYAGAAASGWLLLRGGRRRAGETGFVLSDHADWPGLLAAVRDSGAERVFCTHGFTSVFARHLRELGLDAAELPAFPRPTDALE